MDHSIIAKNPWDVPGKPQDVKIVDWDKDHMDLEWKPPIIDGGGIPAYRMWYFRILTALYYSTN